VHSIKTEDKSADQYAFFGDNVESQFKDKMFYVELESLV
jgi:hypothetical protein